MIEGSKFLKSWERIAVPKLATAGYKTNGDGALRTRGTALELVQLERDTRNGGRFTINLALGHDFARGFTDGKPIGMQNYTDAVFHARLGRLMHGRDQWWPYGLDEPECDRVVTAVADTAIAYADAFFATLADPGDAYLALKKGDLGRENLWYLGLYARHLGQLAEAIDWMGRISGPPTHVKALLADWTAGKAPT